MEHVIPNGSLPHQAAESSSPTARTCVSVIMAAWNAGGWILEAVHSALGQTLHDLEVIVVNDGSTDDTAEKLGSINDPRLRVFHQPNGGQSAALNRGISEARGRFIKFLDADDWMNPEHLAAQVSVLEGTTDELASCAWGYFLESPREVTTRDEVTNRDYIDPMEWLVDSLTKDEGMMGGWKWLIPREVMNRAGGWDTRLSLNNDFEFSIRVLLASGGVRFAPGAVYSYRKGISGALSGSRGCRAMTSAYLTTESGCALLLKRENSERVRRICADRWQSWLYLFYPEFKDLAAGAADRIRNLGGSRIPLGGGKVMRLLLPMLGWKNVRRLQEMSRRMGWNAIMRLKAKRRLAGIGPAGGIGKGNLKVESAGL